MKLEEIVPWGRSYSEYCAMFRLTTEDLAGRILGCGDGPAAFNAEATSKGSQVISVDPIYAFSASEIRARINAVRPEIEVSLYNNADKYVWDHFRTVDDLINARVTAMEAFLEDYPTGLSAGRYLATGLPTLHFATDEFSLALVSHLLFTYSDHLDREMHRQATLTLMRVSREVRIFPLLDMSTKRSPYVEIVQQTAIDQGWRADIERVDYEFQRCGDEMLRLATR